MYRIGDTEVRLRKTTLRDYETLKGIFAETGLELHVIPQSPAELVVHVGGLAMALLEKGQMARLMGVLCEPATDGQEVDWLAMEEEVALEIIAEFIKKKVIMMGGFVTSLLPLLKQNDGEKANINP